MHCQILHEKQPHCKVNFLNMLIAKYYTQTECIWVIQMTLDCTDNNLHYGYIDTNFTKNKQNFNRK